jgi:hypothetical protein
MQNHESSTPTASRRPPWNKGKLIGAKPPLRPKHVWSIRTKLQVEGRTRDLAMFNLAIDSKLRGCDVVSLRVEDVAPHGQAVDRAIVRQQRQSERQERQTAGWGCTGIAPQEVPPRRLRQEGRERKDRQAIEWCRLQQLHEEVRRRCGCSIEHGRGQETSPKATTPSNRSARMVQLVGLIAFVVLASAVLGVLGTRLSPYCG